ncbi:MAG: cation diffusion facilitator family transporter [Treponemataceae bacterium]|nr:cation diffusion facilitator family transporter [Treponemataceae bacterium]
MVTLLAKIFIKDYKNYSVPAVRTAYGVLCSIVGIALNILLSLSKFLAGWLSGSVALTADALNNLSDAASSLCTIIGFRLGAKAADRDHPFGHGRMEYVAGLAVSGIILFMGLELVISSVKSLIHPETVVFSWVSVIIMAAGILVKLYMYLYNHTVGKRINSATLESTAKDSFGDMLSTSVALLSLFASRFTTLPVDGIGGLIVACFIFKAGIDSARETLDLLLGRPPEKEFIEAVEKEVLSHAPICGIHDLMVHDYGPGRRVISLHAEVPGDLNVFELHDVIDQAEVSVAYKFNCWAIIHMDPIDLHNERLDTLKDLAAVIAKSLDERITIHDVRMVPGDTHTNLIFDIVRPFDCKLSEDDLKRILGEIIHKEQPDVFCAITVDAPFVGAL